MSKRLSCEPETGHLLTTLGLGNTEKEEEGRMQDLEDGHCTVQEMNGTQDNLGKLDIC